MTRRSKRGQGNKSQYKIPVEKDKDIFDQTRRKGLEDLEENSKHIDDSKGGEGNLKSINQSNIKKGSLKDKELQDSELLNNEIVNLKQANRKYELEITSRLEEISKIKSQLYSEKTISIEQKKKFNETIIQLEKVNKLASSEKRILNDKLFKLEEDIKKLENSLKEKTQIINSSNEEKNVELYELRKVIFNKIKDAPNAEQSEKYLAQYFELTNSSSSDKVEKRYKAEMEHILKVIREDSSKDNQQMNALTDRLEILASKLEGRMYKLDHRYERVEKVYEELHQLRRRIEYDYHPYIYRINYEAKYDNLKKIIGIIFAILVFGTSLYLIISTASLFYGVILLGIAFTAVGITAVGDLIKEIFGNE